MTSSSRPSLSLWMRLIIGLYTAALLSYIGLGLFSRMMADDYCTAVIGSELGPLAGMQHWYQTWSGLYTNFFIKSAIAPFEPAIHSALTGVFILGIFGILWAAVREVLDAQKIAPSGLIAVLLSGLLTFGLVDGAVSRQPIFWAGALIPYSLPLILIVMSLWLAFRLLFVISSRPVQILTVAGVAVLVFLIAGFSEIYAVYEGALWAVLLLIGTLALPSDKRPRLWGITLLAVVFSGIGLLLVLKSPGNEIRRAAQDQALLINDLGGLIGSVLDFSISIFTSETYGIVHFFLAFFGSLGVWLWAVPSAQSLAALPAPRSLKRAFGLSLLAAFGLVIVAVAPPMYGAGLVAARTLMAVRFTQLALFVLWGYWAAVGLGRSNRLVRLRRSASYQWAKGAVLAAFVLIPAIVIVRHISLIGDFSTYAAQWDARHAAILEAHAQGETSFVIAPLDYNLEDYLTLDRMEKASTKTDAAWVNGCASSYYMMDLQLLYPPEILTPERSN